MCKVSLKLLKSLATVRWLALLSLFELEEETFKNVKKMDLGLL